MLNTVKLVRLLQSLATHDELLQTEAAEDR